MFRAISNTLYYFLKQNFMFFIDYKEHIFGEWSEWVDTAKKNTRYALIIFFKGAYNFWNL